MPRGRRCRQSLARCEHTHWLSSESLRAACAAAAIKVSDRYPLTFGVESTGAACRFKAASHQRKAVVQRERPVNPERSRRGVGSRVAVIRERRRSTHQRHPRLKLRRHEAVVQTADSELGACSQALATPRGVAESHSRNGYRSRCTSWKAAQSVNAEKGRTSVRRFE